QDAEAVGEADWHVELVMVLVRQLGRLPLSKGGRALADVDDDVPDGATAAADELRGAVADLEVHASDDAVRRARMVVLDHLLGDAEIRERAAPVGLHEEPALVAEDARREQQRTVKSGV